MDDVKIAKVGGEYIAYHGTDEGLYVTFEMEALKDEEKSLEQGRPIFFDVPFITIRIPGDKTTTVKRPVKEEDKTRFARHWERFLRQEKVAVEGTPIEQWPLITKSQALELKAMNIITVEVLAQVSDGNLNWHGARDLREKAKSWLDSAKDSSAAAKWAKEKQDMKNEIDFLRGEIEALKSVGFARDDAPVEANAPKKRGRPKKEVTQYGEDVSGISASGG